MTDWITRNIAIFGGGPKVENFRQMSTIYPAREIRRGASPSPLAQGARIELPTLFGFEGRSLDTAEFLAEMETTGLIVVRDGRVVFKDYCGSATTHAPR
jgi:hypothetical protein